MTNSIEQKLSELAVGVEVTLAGINNNYPQKTFLLELGFTADSRITVLRKAPFGDPLHVRVRDSEFAILKADAENIFVKALL